MPLGLHPVEDLAGLVSTASLKRFGEVCGLGTVPVERFRANLEVGFRGKSWGFDGFWALTNGNYGNIKWGTPELILFVFGAMKRLDASVLVETIVVFKITADERWWNIPIDLYYT